MSLTLGIRLQAIVDQRSFISKAKKNYYRKVRALYCYAKWRLGDECKGIWHVQTQDEIDGESSGRVARTMNCVTA